MGPPHGGSASAPPIPQISGSTHQHLLRPAPRTWRQTAAGRSRGSRRRKRRRWAGAARCAGAAGGRQGRADRQMGWAELKPHTRLARCISRGPSRAAQPHKKGASRLGASQPARPHLGVGQRVRGPVHHHQHVLAWVLRHRPAQHLIHHRPQAQAWGQGEGGRWVSGGGGESLLQRMPREQGCGGKPRCHAAAAGSLPPTSRRPLTQWQEGDAVAGAVGHGFDQLTLVQGQALQAAVCCCSCGGGRARRVPQGGRPAHHGVHLGQPALPISLLPGRAAHGCGGGRRPGFAAGGDSAAQRRRGGLEALQRLLRDLDRWLCHGCLAPGLHARGTRCKNCCQKRGLRTAWLSRPAAPWLQSA